MQNYIPKEKRKNILLLTDDIRSQSGVGHIGREIIYNSSDHYNWVQIAGSIKPKDEGKIIDLSEKINEKLKISDSYVRLYPSNGYGNPDLLRKIIKEEKIDALFLLTDPRYFTWVFNMENELRKKIPIFYLQIWDDLPSPQFNREFYESCDLLMAISKQTKNINKLVLDGGEISWVDLDKEKLNEQNKNSIYLKYIPHGLNENNFKPLSLNDPKLIKFKKKLFKDKKYDFVLLFNSRNIRRKQIPDTLLAWKLFIDSLPEEKAKKCTLILHTSVQDPNGTDLEAVTEYLFGEIHPQVMFFPQMISPEDMNLLYNVADGVILLSSAEGWGLALTESILTGTPFIANVTGGMQDQMRFVDENKKWIDFNSQFPSNHRGTYKEHGEWAFPVYPNNLSLIGSVPTPYIFDDRCTFEDAAEQIKKLYNISSKERRKLGLKGRKWALSEEAGFTSKQMTNKVIDSIDLLFKNWKPKKSYGLYTIENYKPRVLNHPIIY